MQLINVTVVFTRLFFLRFGYKITYIEPGGFGEFSRVRFSPPRHVVSGKVPYEAVVAGGRESRRSRQWRNDTCTKRGHVSRFYLKKRARGWSWAHWENLEKSRSGLVATRVRIGTALGRYFYFLLIRESRVGLFTSSDSYSQFSAERR